jgi:4-amino-4-deoxy-L-arabinose transferase-like glycosyltransferase
MKFMKANRNGTAEASNIVRTALLANLALLAVAVGGPRMVLSTDAAALLFAIPMALILVVGAAAAIWSYILARRESRTIPWTAFLPLAVFALGVVGTILLVQTDAAWNKPPVEIHSGQK